MDNKEKKFLALEERMALAEKSQAVSSEAAVSQVQRFAGIHAGDIFCGNDDVMAMNELTGEFWDHPSVDINTYHGFCESFFLAKNHDNPLCVPSSMDASEELFMPAKPVWGIRMNNATVLLGLTLLDHAKGRMKSRDVYHCMRMTLEQYQDALMDLMLQRGERRNPFTMTPDFFQEIWKMCLKGYDVSKPLADVLADFLRQYIAGWKEFDRLEHILRCMEALSCYLEQEGAGEVLPQAEADRRQQDPYGYYFALACAYPDDVPDPGSEGLAKGTVRSRVFLPERDYSQEALLALAEKAPSQEFRGLLEKNISGERLGNAMGKLNSAVILLYMLWVEPYLSIWKDGSMKDIFSKLLSNGIAAAEKDRQN